MVESVSTTNNLCRRLKTEVFALQKQLDEKEIPLCICNFRARTRNASASMETLEKITRTRNVSAAPAPVTHPRRGNGA